MVNITVQIRPEFAWQCVNSTDSRPEWDEVRRRFAAKVRVLHPDTCWEWTGSRSSKRSGGYRYGQFSWSARYGRAVPVGAHRVAYELAHGVELTGDQHVLHSCDNPPCVNPKHLFLGNQDLNMKDAASKGRFHTPRPKKQKVSDAQCDEIVNLVRSGMLQTQVAERYGITKALVSGIVRGIRRQYRHRPALEQTA